ncbi:hypothetical protein NC652_007073 [Populus alba x Populus x berolinensis]|nr:hypothetical protein NC652_007073 [Populus alba x Populus x berolinensis]
MGRIKPQDLLQQSKKKKAPGRMSVTAIVSYCLILLLTLFFLYSTYKHWSLRYLRLVLRSSVQTENVESGFGGGHAFVDSKKYDLPGCVQYVFLLKHEAFMFGASKTKHDDLGSELLITTAPIPDPSEKLMVLDGKSKRTYLKAVVLIRSFSMLPWSSIPDCVLPVKLAIGTAVHFGMSHIPLEGTTMVWRSAENQAV